MCFCHLVTGEKRKSRPTRIKREKKLINHCDNRVFYMKASAHKRRESCMYHLILNDYSILLYLYCLLTRLYFSFHNKNLIICYFFKWNILHSQSLPFVIFVKTKKNQKKTMFCCFFSHYC